MSMEKFKTFAGTKQGRLILGCCGILIVCWSFIFVQFTGGFSALFPGEEKIKRLKQDIRKLKSQVAENRVKADKYDAQKKEYRKKLVTFWNEKRDGLADTVLRNTIQNAAKDLELTLSALGSVRITRINSELYYAEVDNLSVSAPYDVLIKFLAKLSESRPSLHWRRLDLRPEPVRFNARNNSTNLLQNAPATIRMRLNGAVRVIGYDGKLPLQMDKTQKKEEKNIENIPAKTGINTLPAGNRSAAGKHVAEKQPEVKQTEIPASRDIKQAAGGAK